MITGAHCLIYSTDSTKDRDFFRDVLKLSNVDLGEGWLIFGLPPAELAIHPSAQNDLHELYLMCDDINEFTHDMEKRKVGCTPVQNKGWGLLTHLTLPSGGKLGVYQPLHERPASTPIRKAGKSSKTKPAKKNPGLKQKSK
jgi:hypothetical protein